MRQNIIVTLLLIAIMGGCNKVDAKTKFNVCKKEILNTLTVSKNIRSLKKMLSTDFYYSDERIEYQTINLHYNNDDKVLSEIDKMVVVDDLIFVLKNGKDHIGKEIAVVSPGTVELSKKYPAIDFKYDHKEKTWKIESIRYRIE